MSHCGLKWEILMKGRYTSNRPYWGLPQYGQVLFNKSGTHNVLLR
jgi:hypothetical protein